MNSHKNAPLTPKGREAMVGCVEAGLSNTAAARQFNTTPKTVAKWVERFRAGGVDGLRDRSSRPLSLPSQTAPATCAVVEVLRRQRHTGKQIAAEVGVSAATVSRILRRLGLNRIRDLEPAEPVRRYEREHPGELIHIDIKKLGRFDKIGHRITGDRTGQSNGRGVGWEFVMSVSTITPASPSARFCRTRRRKAPYRSSRRPWPITKASMSPSPVS
jgi:transposase